MGNDHPGLQAAGGGEQRELQDRSYAINGSNESFPRENSEGKGQQIA